MALKIDQIDTSSIPDGRASEPARTQMMHLEPVLDPGRAIFQYHVKARTTFELLQLNTICLFERADLFTCLSCSSRALFDPLSFYGP